ncbi:MAG: hypothetical protein ACPG7F_06010, partial [Aggregatilineales bacterium]
TLHEIHTPRLHDGQLRSIWGWHFTATLPLTYSIAFHIDDAAGQFTGLQHDFNLAESALTGCHNFSIDVRSLVPGTYQLYAIVYNGQTNTRLPGQLLADETNTTNRLLIQEFVVR